MSLRGRQVRTRLLDLWRKTRARPGRALEHAAIAMGCLDITAWCGDDRPDVPRPRPLRSYSARNAVNSDIDGAIELVCLLDALSAESEVAAHAPRSKALYRYLADGMTNQLGRGEPPEAFRDLTETLLTRLGIWWSADAYRALPVMTPWCVRDRSCRYDQGPESWGAPRADGFLRDDNSIIKKLPLPVRVSAREGHPYNGRKPWRGFTACHIWRDLPGGGIAGEDPWLYSFIPNLIWLPSWLAPLTDRHGFPVQELLQRTSYRRFSSVEVDRAVASYAEYCWSQLPAPRPGRTLNSEDMPEFVPGGAFFRRRIAYLDKFVTGCDDVLARGALAKKLICTRYTVGLPAVDADAVALFAAQMRTYRDAAEASCSEYGN